MKHYYLDDTGKYMFIEDIALITLSNPYLKTNRFLRPICIPLGPKFKNLDDATWIGQKVKFSGWGYTDEKELISPDILQYAILEIWDPKKCFPRYYDTAIPKTFGELKKKGRTVHLKYFQNTYWWYGSKNAFSSPNKLFQLL